jgi:toxin ParE1/3/4
MARVVRSSEARIDLAEIAIYIANENPAAAERGLDGVNRLSKLLATNPDMGEAVDHLLPGMRRHTYGRYLLFYKPRPDGILLYRVLHGSRRIEELNRD